MSANTASPKVLKKLEKEVLKEGKDEDKYLKNALKEVSHLEKAQSKARKVSGYAERALSKHQQKGLDMAKELNKVEHAHEVARTNIRGMEKDVQLKHQNQQMLQQELDAKKGQLEALAADQQTRNRGRQQRLSEIRAGHVPGAAHTQTLIPPQVQMTSPTIPGGYPDDNGVSGAPGAQPNTSCPARY